jgi:hypothetical protein
VIERLGSFVYLGPIAKQPNISERSRYSVEFLNDAGRGGNPGLVGQRPNGTMPAQAVHKLRDHPVFVADFYGDGLLFGPGLQEGVEPGQKAAEIRKYIAIEIAKLQQAAKQLVFQHAGGVEKSSHVILAIDQKLFMGDDLWHF